MTASVPAYIPCGGGLVLNSNKFSLMDKAGVATVLINFEVALNGGYRRVNGYQKFGQGSATRPDGETPILGVAAYGLGIVVCAGTDVFYTEDGITWLQINKDTGEAGVTEANLSVQTTLTRTNQGQASFILAKGTIDHATNPYGVLYIATGADEVAHFHIDGTGGSRTFTYTEITTPEAGDLVENFDHHLCVVDTVNSPNTVYYSARDDYDDFTGPGSGSVRVIDEIVGIKAFRNSLYIFSKTSIYKLLDINDPSRIRVEDVTKDLGCVSAYTIQEIGGDLIFLSQDGFRSIAATDRINDVDLPSLSEPIQPLVRNIVENASLYTFSSVVLKQKGQYRVFYTTSGGLTKGLTATYVIDRTNGVAGYQWTELRDVNAYTINTDRADATTETYHGSIDGYVYQHDTGNSFDGGNISALFESPYLHFGDLGLRKTLHYVNIAVSQEGLLKINLRPVLDFNSKSVIQPPAIAIEQNSSDTSLYGEAIYGTSSYGISDLPFIRQPLQGSGHSVAMRFFSEGINAPYTIHGYHIELMPSGRK